MSRLSAFKSEPGSMLPPTAPRIRLTAGIGTAGQKTWNLRRPVTVIGSGRHVTISLADKTASKAHCAIVNTGTAVLLADLCSHHGTLCNGQPVRLTVLKDGDVLEAAGTRIQIAIHRARSENEQTQSGVQLADLARPPEPLLVQMADGSRRWSIDDAVALIGRRSNASVHLDDRNVSLAHALVFCIDGRPAVCDLGSRNGIRVNGHRATLSWLNPADRLAIGPFEIKLAGQAAHPHSAPQVAPSPVERLARREAEILARSLQLDEREAALETKGAEIRLEQERLREWQERLLAWQQEMEQQGSAAVGQAPSDTGAVGFTGDIGSAEAPSRAHTVAAGSGARATLDRVARALAQMNADEHPRSDARPPPNC